MSLNRGMLAVGVLVGSGFCGGFLLSNGSGEVFGLKPVHAAPAGREGGDIEEEAAAGIVNAAAVDPSDSKGRRHPKINQSGGGPGEAGGSASAKAQGGQGAAPGTIVPLAGADALALLSGNTVDANPSKAGTRLIYFAPRGFRAEGGKGSFVVKAWNPDAAVLCQAGSDGALVCRPAQARGLGGEHAPGSKVGELMVPGGRWVPVYRGNLLRVPDHIPGIDSAVTAADPPAGRAAASPGQAALDALIGHAAAVDGEGPASRPARIVAFMADGSRVTVRRTDPAADATVSLGRWTFAKGVLCTSEDASPADQACARPEVLGTRGVRLVSTRNKPEVRLTLLAEAPKVGTATQAAE